MSGEFRYDAEKHRYYFGDRRVTGITESLERSGLAPKPPMFGKMKENFEYAGHRGRSVHRACELYDLGQLQNYDLDPSIQSYVVSWSNFCADYGFSSTISETPLGHEIYQFGGTPDAAGPCQKLAGFSVVERKVRELYDYDGFQLAAQDLLIAQAQARLTPSKILAVRLKPDGEYSVRDFSKDYLRYRNVFLAAVTVSNWQISQEKQ